MKMIIKTNEDGETISELYEKLRQAKEQYAMYQRSQEYEKREINMWDPYDGLDKEVHEMSCQQRIWDNRYMLRHLQDDIKELRKKIKTLQRNTNKK